MKFTHNTILLLICALAALTSCRHDDVIFIPEEVSVTQPRYTDIVGFYLLNEGNMNTNKSTLDFYDYRTGVYMRNIYAAANPDVPMEMGDVGNDIAIYGSRLYAVINCSNKVEVMDARTTRRIGQVDIPNCRYIKFHKGYAYVTSYAGEVIIDPNYEQTGYVAKVDTATLQVVARCEVGFQPDGIEISEGKIFVANSGGYMEPNYEETISVIDLETFREEERIPIAKNLHRLIQNKRGILWISARGDYYNEPSDIYAYDIRKHRLVKRMDCRVSNWCMVGDSLYVISSEWSEITKRYVNSATLINAATLEVVKENIIDPETSRKILRPYGVAVDPVTRDIFVTDARDYFNPGRLYAFDRDGNFRWRVTTGDIPAHIVFLGKNLNEN